MLAQYRCACCNHTVSASDKECSNCGSHHILSPHGFWIFCIVACFAVVIIFQLAKMTGAVQPETPKPPSLIDVLKTGT